MHCSILLQSSICRGLTWPVSPLIYPGGQRIGRILCRTLHPRNSQFIYLIGQCIAIEFAAPSTAKGRRVPSASPTNIHFHYFPRVYPRFRLIVSARKRGRGGSERVKMMAAAKGRKNPADSRPMIFSSLNVS